MNSEWIDRFVHKIIFLFIKWRGGKIPIHIKSRNKWWKETLIRDCPLMKVRIQAGNFIKEWCLITYEQGKVFAYRPWNFQMVTHSKPVWTLLTILIFYSVQHIDNFLTLVIPQIWETCLFSLNLWGNNNSLYRNKYLLQETDMSWWENISNSILLW